MAISQLSTITLNGNVKYQNSHQFRTACENGNPPLGHAFSISPAYRSPCWTSMGSAWTKGSRSLSMPKENLQITYASVLVLLAKTTSSFPEKSSRVSASSKVFLPNPYSTLIGNSKGNAFGAIYLGRGKEPSMAYNDTDKAVRLTTNDSDPSLLIRDNGKQAFDAACFHYSTYRSMMRFLGMMTI